MLTDLQSEMLGILFGDGSMFKSHSYQIVISGHKFEDREYLIDRVCPMFSQLFSKSLTVRDVKDENAMMPYTYSKRVALILHDWGMPFGLKKLFTLQPATSLE